MKRIIMLSMTVLAVACGRKNCTIQVLPDDMPLADYIAQSPMRAGCNTAPYEFYDREESKAPAGYSIAYISHYGRHGSRNDSHRADYNDVVFSLERAKAEGILSAEGEQLLDKAIRVVDAHRASNNTLSAVGENELSTLGERFCKAYKGYLRRSSRKVRAAVSTSERTLRSMAAFNSSLLKGCPSLEISTECGYFPQKYMDINCNMERKGSFHAFRDSIALIPISDTLCVYSRLFTDEAAARKIIGSAQKFLLKVYFTARNVNALGLEDCDIYSYIPHEALLQFAKSQFGYFYISHGNSAEFGQERLSLNAPILADICQKADAVLSGEDMIAVDLRFGHDNTLRALASGLGIEGIGQRWETAEIPDAMTAAQALPFASNLEMVFYTSRKKDSPALVKLLWNERECRLMGLEPVCGDVYYDWEEVKAAAWERIGSRYLGPLQGKAINPKNGNHEGYQGFDIWGDYALSAQNRGTACVYALGSEKFSKLGEFRFGSWDPHNHSNVLSFLPVFYKEDDPMPLVAVSRAQRGTLNGLKDEIRIERILPDFRGAQQVRIINFDDRAHNFGYALQWVVDRENGFLYGYGNTIDNTNPANRHRIIKFAIPDVLAPGPHMITLRPEDALENYLVEDTFKEPFMPIGQGLFIREGRLYMPTGFGKFKAPSMLYVWDLEKREMECIDLTRSTFSELEDCSWHDGGLVIQAQSGLWKIKI